jgi:tetratricopeptide (TPR) repeat protein
MEEARECGRAALDLALSRQVRRSELFAQLGLGEVYLRSGLPRDARYHLHQALTLARAQQMRRLEAQARQLLGRAAARLGEAEAAAREVQQALDLAAAVGARPLQSAALLDRAGLAQAAGDFTAAEEAATPALALATEMGAAELTWQAHHALAVSQAARHQGEEARTHFRAAVDGLEAARESLRLAGAEDSLLEDATRWPLYTDLARFLRAVGEEAEAARLIADAGWPPLDQWWVEAGRKT